MSLSGKAVVLGVTALLVVVSSACSRQGEGERCDREAAGDTDCESPLICWDFTPNAPAATRIQRCCPPANLPITDSRCDSSSIANTGGTGGVASSSGGNASSSAGTEAVDSDAGGSSGAGGSAE